jgi:hypothetical protein
MTSEARPATTIPNWLGRMIVIFLLLCGCGLAVLPVFDRPPWAKHAPVSVVAAYLTVVVLVSIWLLYRGSRMGVRFDDHGVTIRRFLPTRRVGWTEVSHFADGAAGLVGEGRVEWAWALDIVLRDGRIVTTRAGMIGNPASFETLSTIQQAAARYGIPASLTGYPARPGPLPRLR